MLGDTTRRSLTSATTVGASQYTSVDVTACTAAAAVDKRRETTMMATGTELPETTVMATGTELPGQSICLDELHPVLEDPADD